MFFKAFTLIESLITLSILIISFYLISPVIFQLQDNIALNNEIENIQSFIYQIQAKARYQKQSYTLTASQNLQTSNWCLIAIQKQTGSSQEIVCDCLNVQQCHLTRHFLLYRNTHQHIVLKNQSLYPKSLINIDGTAGRLESKCLALSLNQASKILQFDQWGRIYVIPKDKRSRCKS
ncbi:type II secretion system GspH family protein [Actinobacillus genomosp. 1]|uniref:pilus assembly FimT family protein n=1 Tax=Actinobacillus genomosp. 1 TaxID=254839 RepID=UPI002441B5B1|nr:type II secretion system protein [Actinobacillus genomosp. 1]WGE33845.1 type II secretion system GspH family protein [Actinobacillus genomosp. 1]